MKDGAPRRRRLRRSEAKARTRELLLDAAAQPFARKGFAGASVEEIAEAAGFSTGAVYSNFGSKDKLFLELLSERATSAIAEAARIVGDGGTQTQDPALALGRMLVEVADKDTDSALLQAEFWLYAVRNPDILAKQFREPREALAGLITRGLVGLGQTTGASPEPAATIVLALFQGLLLQRRRDPESVPDEMFGRAIRWLYSGIDADAAHAPGETAAADTLPGPAAG